jgi:hypothetical protein
MAVILTNETLAYFESLASHGLMLVNSQGKGDFSPAAKNLVIALHEVLAGGEVQISVQIPGDEIQKNELNLRLKKALDSINAVASTDVGGYTP